MRRNQIFFVALLGVLSSTAPLVAEEAQPSWLFVQTGSNFTSEGNRITLPYEREIFAFTDRPNRSHAYWNAHEMVHLWDLGKDSFAEDPPNAVLTWVDNGEVREAEIELISASVDNLGRAITYEFAAESSAALPEFGTYASLFVDDWFDKDTFCKVADDQAKEGETGAVTEMALTGEPPSPQSAIEAGVGSLEQLAAGC